jgi:hypothetical protein
VKIADVKDLREQEFIRSKLGVHEFEDLVEHYQGKWTRTRMKKGTKTASVRRRNMGKQPLATKTSRNDRPSYPGTHRNYRARCRTRGLGEIIGIEEEGPGGVWSSLRRVLLAEVQK